MENDVGNADVGKKFANENDVAKFLLKNLLFNFN
jgi:hypothetical protein